MNKDSKIVTIISVIIVVAAVAVLAMFVGNMFGNKSENDAQQTSTDSLGSKENPVKIATTDMALTGSEFGKKYGGKYITFDGLLQGTSTVGGAKKPHTAIVFGEDIDKGAFSDGSLFWITAGSSTFSDDLKEYAVDNDTPYKTKEYPKVRVTAKVSEFSENYSAVQLEPNNDINGQNPSVISR